MKMITYKTWLLCRYLDVDSPEGDLARDIAGDRDFPTSGGFQAA